jgi:Papain-like cysteine protease AvrRpt2
MNEELTVGYHQQDTNYYCGAACAQMVLHSVGQPLLSQDVLYNDNHSHTIEPSS